MLEWQLKWLNAMPSRLKPSVQKMPLVLSNTSYQNILNWLWNDFWTNHLLTTKYPRCWLTNNGQTRQLLFLNRTGQWKLILRGTDETPLGLTHKVSFYREIGQFYAPSEVLHQSNLTTTIDAAAVTDGHLHTLKRQKDGRKGCGLCCTTALWRRPVSGEPASSSQKEDLMNYGIPILCHSALKWWLKLM